MTEEIEYTIDELGYLLDWQKVIIKELYKQPKSISTKRRKKEGTLK